MVQINLLPESEKRIRRAKIELKIKLKPLLYILIGIMVTIIVVWAKLGMDLAGKQRQLVRLDKQLQALTSTLERLEELKQEKQKLQSKLEFMQEHIQREVLWAENLNRLSNLVPPGIWLESVVLHTQREGQIERYVKFDINGMAVSVRGEEMIDLISGFMTALKRDEVFTRQFSEIKLVSSHRSKTGDVEVMRFKLFCQFR